MLLIVALLPFLALRDFYSYYGKYILLYDVAKLFIFNIIYFQFSMIGLLVLFLLQYIFKGKKTCLEIPNFCLIFYSMHLNKEKENQNY